MTSRSELADAREVLLEMDKLVANLREENARICNDLDAMKKWALDSDAENDALREEVAEWKQAAGVEAGLRRELKNELDMMRQDIPQPELQ